MIKRYVHYLARGTGDGLCVVEDGLCDASCDPMQVAMTRCRALTQCKRVVLTVEPAFSLACSGARHKTRRSIRIQAAIDAAERARKQSADEFELQQAMMRRNRALYLGMWQGGSK